LRKLAAAALAVPVVVGLYVPLLLRRSVVARLGIAIGVASLTGFVALGLASPSRTVANPPLPAIVPLSPAAFSSSIAANSPLNAPVSISFSAPMDVASVAASLDVSPPTAVNLSWDETGTRLTVTPKSHWAPGTYHTITVGAGALGQSGRPMSKPARAVFLTRAETTASIAATQLAGKKAKVATAFSITFDQQVAIGDVRRALVTKPVIRGSLDVAKAAAGTSAFVFTPSEPLAPGTLYTVSLTGLRDADGVVLDTSPSVAVTTMDAPAVVRFRPTNNAKKVDRDAVLSVRFNQAMDHASTKAAVRVTAAGKVVAGKVSFAEKSTVLVFRPTSKLPYGSKVEMSIAQTARSAAGATLGKASRIDFRTEAKPKPLIRTTSGGTSPSSGGGSGSSGGSGGSVGGGSWAAVESYYMRLMNCTRTGGWVTSTGACSSPGGRDVRPLSLSAGISSHVSRPYAKKLAVNNQCSHFIGGNPGDRLRAAGYTNYTWAENIGCRSGNAYDAVLGSHLFFQSEKSTNGGHYVNLMNAKYDRAGVGVWVSGGRVRLVVDFYHP
jgi:uncharacterized protein YkwD